MQRVSDSLCPLIKDGIIKADNATGVLIGTEGLGYRAICNQGNKGYSVPEICI